MLLVRSAQMTRGVSFVIYMVNASSDRKWRNILVMAQKDALNTKYSVRSHYLRS